jgi:hypothetical protein
MRSDDGYLLDNRQAEAGVRFHAMARLFDPVTFRHVDRLGIARRRAALRRVPPVADAVM